MPEYEIRPYRPGEEAAILRTFNEVFAGNDPDFVPRGRGQAPGLASERCAQRGDEALAIGVLDALAERGRRLGRGLELARPLDRAAPARERGQLHGGHVVAEWHRALEHGIAEAVRLGLDEISCSLRRAEKPTARPDDAGFRIVKSFR